MEQLLTIRDKYFDEGIAQSSRRSYGTGWKHYLKFCAQVRMHIFPVTESKLELFAASLGTRLAAKTIKTYLAGIRFHCLKKGMNIGLKNMEGLKTTIRGIRRCQGGSMGKPKRDPIKLAHLHNLRVVLRVTMPQDYNMIMAALTIGFFGLLRCSEFVAPSQYHFDPGVNLRRQDIHVDESGKFLEITIKGSKTDPFREGAIVTLPKLKSRLCPINTMREYLVNKRRGEGPLFQWENGSYLTRENIAQIFSKYFDDVNLNTHSLRIGGATLLSEHGVPEHIIQKIGRWKSDCFKKYVRLSTEHIQQAYKRMDK